MRINVEDEERFFNSIKNITRSTTNNHPGHIIGNFIVRHEVEFKTKEKYEFSKNNDSTSNEIRMLEKNLFDDGKNSFFSLEFIKEKILLLKLANTLQINYKFT